MVQMKSTDVEFQRKKNNSTVMSQSDHMEAAMSPLPERVVN
jgi:hypothetical protein